MFLKNLRLAAAVALTATLGAGAAQAVTVDFMRITSNSSADAAAQLKLDVTDGTDANAGMALFMFSVVTGSNPGANIAEIYFDDGMPPLFTPPPSVVATSGNVAFTGDGSANPQELPGAGTVTPAFQTSLLLKSEASGNNATGVTVGESLTLGLTYQSGVDFNALLASLNSGNFRIGLHVRSLLAGQSDSFVNKPPSTDVIPLPASALLLLGGVAGLGVLRTLRREPTG